MVKGGENISLCLYIEKKLRECVINITNWNIGLDIKILFRTVMVVLRKDGSM